jgi:hypothetical protein
MHTTDIVKAVQGLLNYYLNPKKRLREEQARQVVPSARLLRESRGGGSKSQVVPPREGSESQDVVMDADHYPGRGDHYDQG